MSSLMSSLILSYHTIPRYNKLTLSATMLFDWSIVFSPPSLVIPPVSYSRSHAAVFSQTHILKRNISRRFEALSRCCFFGRLFFAVSRPCVVVEITPATVSPYSSFSNSFFRKFDNSFPLLFFLSSFLRCVVVEFTPATVLSLYSSFSKFFFENSTGCGVISFVVRFALQCCVVVEFHSSHSYSSSSWSLLPPPSPTPGHTFFRFF